MPLETDLDRIEQLARRRERENQRFRRFLKGCDRPGEEIDAIVHRLHDEIAPQIDCRSCGNCCSLLSPQLQEVDVARLAGHMNMERDAFVREYLEEDGEEGYLFNALPCPFLRSDCCAVYPARPDICRSYPHLLKQGFTQRLHQAFLNYSVCPIVYHVVERLKEEIWDRGR